jgi:hypothetical protein
MRVPVVVQYREILSGEERGTIKKVNIWCKYLEDVLKYRKELVIKRSTVNSPSYRVLKAKLVVKDAIEIKETYEEGVP